MLSSPSNCVEDAPPTSLPRILSPLLMPSSNSNPIFPSQSKNRFQNQVGGHGVNNDKDGFLQCPQDPSVILKPVARERKGAIERDFYLTIASVTNDATIIHRKYQEDPLNKKAFQQKQQPRPIASVIDKIQRNASSTEEETNMVMDSSDFPFSYNFPVLPPHMQQELYKAGHPPHAIASLGLSVYLPRFFEIVKIPKVPNAVTSFSTCLTKTADEETETCQVASEHEAKGESNIEPNLTTSTNESAPSFTGSSFSCLSQISTNSDKSIDPNGVNKTDITDESQNDTGVNTSFTGRNNINSLSTPPSSPSFTEYIAMLDETQAYVRPCIADIKLGLRTFDDDATLSKIAKEREKYLPQGLFGFRVVGMKVYKPPIRNPANDAKRTGNDDDKLNSDGTFTSYSKSFGRSVTLEEDMRHALRLFFGDAWGNSSGRSSGRASGDNSTRSDTSQEHTASCGDNEENPSSVDNNNAVDGASDNSTNNPSEYVPDYIIQDIQSQVESLLGFLRRNPCFHFFSSSLLVVYEGDPIAREAQYAAKKALLLQEARGKLSQSLQEQDNHTTKITSSINIDKTSTDQAQTSNPETHYTADYKLTSLPSLPGFSLSQRAPPTSVMMMDFAHTYPVCCSSQLLSIASLRSERRCIVEMVDVFEAERKKYQAILRQKDGAVSCGKKETDFDELKRQKDVAVKFAVARAMEIYSTFRNEVQLQTIGVDLGKNPEVCVLKDTLWDKLEQGESVKPSLTSKMKGLQGLVTMVCGLDSTSTLPHDLYVKFSASLESYIEAQKVVHAELMAEKTKAKYKKDLRECQENEKDNNNHDMPGSLKRPKFHHCSTKEKKKKTMNTFFDLHECHRDIHSLLDENSMLEETTTLGALKSFNSNLESSENMSFHNSTSVTAHPFSANNYILAYRALFRHFFDDVHVNVGLNTGYKGSFMGYEARDTSLDAQFSSSPFDVNYLAGLQSFAGYLRTLRTPRSTPAPPKVEVEMIKKTK